MAQMTITPKNATPARVKEAATLTAAMRDAGQGSNRSNWLRIEALLAAVLQVLASGQPCEVTDLFGVAGSSPAYNVLHRTLSAGPLRPYWSQVQALALVDCAEQGKSITGTTNTTAREARLFICPVQ